MTKRLENPSYAIFKINEHGYPRFTNSGFLPREEALALRDQDFPGCEVLTYGQYKARQDPDSMSEMELRTRLKLPPATNIPAKVVVITGVHPGMTRDGARKEAERRGFRVVGKISPAVTHLWIGDKPGASKVKEAEKLGIRICKAL